MVLVKLYHMPLGTKFDKVPSSTIGMLRSNQMHSVCGSVERESLFSENDQGLCIRHDSQCQDFQKSFLIHMRGGRLIWHKKNCSLGGFFIPASHPSFVMAGKSFLFQTDNDGRVLDEHRFRFLNSNRLTSTQISWNELPSSFAYYFPLSFNVMKIFSACTVDRVTSRTTKHNRSHRASATRPTSSRIEYNEIVAWCN